MAEEKKGKYTHTDIQNEYLKIVTLPVLRDISRSIQNGVFYTIMADEVTDSSNQEQFMLCLRWVGEDLNPHEELIGLHVILNICVDTLVAFNSRYVNSYEFVDTELQRLVLRWSKQHGRFKVWGCLSNQGRRTKEQFSFTAMAILYSLLLVKQ